MLWCNISHNFTKTCSSFQAQTACSTGCICDQPSNWKTEELLLNHLEAVEILEFRGSEHEVSFVKRLLNWATVLKKMTVTFHIFVTESVVNKLSQMFQGYSHPEICFEFHMYRDFVKVLYAVMHPKDKVPGCNFSHCRVFFVFFLVHNAIHENIRMQVGPSKMLCSIILCFQLLYV